EHPGRRPAGAAQCGRCAQRVRPPFQKAIIVRAAARKRRTLPHLPSPCAERPAPPLFRYKVGNGMAERSFKKEVQKLKLGEGHIFHGEGILAVTKALLQSGVSYVAGYQGAPISHLMDVLTDANDILEELGVHFEHSASDATAAATLGASVHYPLREIGR